MAINRNHFKNDFQGFPPWLCPTCRQGTLRQISDSQKIVETGPSKFDHSNDDWDPDWITERFTGLLICANISCGEVIAVCGTTSNWLDYHCGPAGDTGSQLIKSFRPTAIVPAPAMFPIPPKAPEELVSQISNDFSLFWMDFEACAGRLRVCIEMFLDDMKIPRTRTGKAGRDSSVNLDMRIKEYETINSETSNLLLAVKWIGNAGSHVNLSKLDREDLLDVFEILGYVLEETYVSSKKRLTASAHAINTAKGKPARAKK